MHRATKNHLFLNKETEIFKSKFVEGWVMLIIICEGLCLHPQHLPKKARLFVVPEPGDSVLSQKIRWETFELDTHHTHKQKGVIYILIKANTMLLHTFFLHVLPALESV